MPIDGAVDGAPIDGAVDGAPIDGAPIDGAPIDGPPVVLPESSFDVAFGNKFRIAWNFAGTGFLGLASIVNTGAKPLSLSKLTIASVTDNDPTITSVFAIERPSDTPLDPGKAAGELGGQAISLIIEGGIMTEPLVDEVLQFSLAFLGCTDACIGRTVHVDVTLQIDDGEIVLPLDASILASQITVIDTAARRSAHKLVPPTGL